MQLRHRAIGLVMWDRQTSGFIHIRLQYHLIWFMFIFILWNLGVGWNISVLHRTVACDCFSPSVTVVITVHLALGQKKTWQTHGSSNMPQWEDTQILLFHPLYDIWFYLLPLNHSFPRCGGWTWWWSSCLKESHWKAQTESGWWREASAPIQSSVSSLDTSLSLSKSSTSTSLTMYKREVCTGAHFHVALCCVWSTLSFICELRYSLVKLKHRFTASGCCAELLEDTTAWDSERWWILLSVLCILED